MAEHPRLPVLARAHVHVTNAVRMVFDVGAGRHGAVAAAPRLAGQDGLDRRRRLGDVRGPGDGLVDAALVRRVAAAAGGAEQQPPAVDGSRWLMTLIGARDDDRRLLSERPLTHGSGRPRAAGTYDGGVSTRRELALLSVVAPVYQEEATIERFCAAVAEALRPPLRADARRRRLHRRDAGRNSSSSPPPTAASR